MPTKTAAKKSPTAKSSRRKDSSDTYTDPELRERLKQEIMAGERGGHAGQWSARKAQLLAREYEQAGGGYKHSGELTDTQQHLKEWTEEEWTTADGQPAIHNDGTTERYLPKEAWEKLTPEQKRATNRKKIEGSRHGEQFVQNTEAAAEAARQARHNTTTAPATKRRGK